MVGLVAKLKLVTETPRPRSAFRITLLQVVKDLLLLTYADVDGIHARFRNTPFHLGIS